MSECFVHRIASRLRALDSRPILGEFRDRRCIDVSAAALDEQVQRAREGLRRAGVRRGDRVALIAPASSGWVAVDLAVISEGAITVPLYERLPPADVAHVLDDCRPRLVVADGGSLPEGVGAAHACTSLDALLDAPPVRRTPARLAPDAAVTIVYTSGTSGEPKGVVLTRANFDHVVDAVGKRLESFAPATDERRVYHFLPLAFVPSRLMLWAHLAHGAPVVLAGELTRFAEELRSVNPRYFLTVPLVLARIACGVERALARRGRVVRWLFERARTSHGRLCRGDGALGDRLMLGLARAALLNRIKASIAPGLELIVCGSAPLAEGLQRFFALLGVPVLQGYGLTETAGVMALERPEAARPGAVGTPLDGCEVRLGAGNEVLCRGPNVFAGYWQRPRASAVMLRDGWLHTGDRGEIDAHGSLRITGRVRALLVLASGHNVQPEPLEQAVLDACPGLEQVMVVGHGRPFLGAVVSGDLDEGRIAAGLAALNATLPHYRRVRAFHRADPFSLDSGLLTANGKLRRGAIETFHADAIESMYRTQPEEESPCSPPIPTWRHARGARPPVAVRARSRPRSITGTPSCVRARSRASP